MEFLKLIQYSEMLRTIRFMAAEGMNTEEFAKVAALAVGERHWW